MDAQRVVIVGGGVLGTMHALEACRRGWEVTHLEADAGPRRASVRNFGLVWVSGRAPGPNSTWPCGPDELWEQIAVHSPAVGFRPDGSLTVARHGLGAGLDGRGRGPARRRRPGLRAARPRRCPGRQPRRPGRRWSAACSAAATPWSSPGLVLGALRVTLEATGRYTWLPRRQVVDVETSSDGHHGRRRPPGSPPRGIGCRPLHRRPPVRARWTDRRHPGRRTRSAGAASRCCRRHPADERLTTAVADGDSMRYYPAFDLPGRDGLPTPPRLRPPSGACSSSSFSGRPAG